MAVSAHIGWHGYYFDPRSCGERECGAANQADGHSVLAVRGTFPVAIHADSELQSQARYLARGTCRLPASLRRQIATLHIRRYRPIHEYRFDRRRGPSPGRPSIRTASERSPGSLYGNIKNDYDDYLGTGVPLRNNAELRSFIARYTYRVDG